MVIILKDTWKTIIYEIFYPKTTKMYKEFVKHNYNLYFENKNL